MRPNKMRIAKAAIVISMAWDFVLWEGASILIGDAISQLLNPSRRFWYTLYFAILGARTFYDLTRLRIALMAAEPRGVYTLTHDAAKEEAWRDSHERPNA